MATAYQYQIVEQTVKQLWEQEKVFSFNPENKKIFSIDTPPPTVSGTLHVGHIFSYTQTDIIARFKRMQGYEVLYPFGFDDNGLATERFVEKKRGISPFVVGRAAFVQLCLEETALAEEQFKQLWQSVGLSVDWQLWYSTISPRVRALSQESFITLYNKGYIYRRNEPALFCTTCRTTVAQAELDDHTVNSSFNDIVFTTSSGDRVTISTTRPELLPSCVALFYNPADERYQQLKDKQAIVPLYNYEIPILADEHVDQTKGTGLVMCCTFGDKADIEWYKKYKLPYRESIGHDGLWVKDTLFLAGLTVYQARKEIIKQLTEAGFLVNQRPTSHTINIHERCKQPIEYLTIPQWYINILDHKQEFLTQADQINWYPAYMKSRYVNWVENLGWDWCISRQRFAGIPFPVWYCKNCGHTVVANNKQLPIDPQEQKYSGTCPACKSTEFIPDTDVMDTWNTSSITPYICCSLINKQNDSVFDTALTTNFLPMSMRPQAHDIIRTWAFYTIVKAWYHSKKTPWKNIVISGHVLSSSAEKISKSRDNAPTDPVQLVATWSADAVRFWTASATLGTDTAFSESQLKIGQRTVTKLWNAFIFVEQHIQAAATIDKPQKLGAVNEWILHKAACAFNNYERELNNNEFSLALNHAETFFWQQFCDNYLELVKNQLFKPEQYDAQEVAATRWTLSHAGLRILQLYAPFMPFVTEQLYQTLYRTTVKIPSIHRTLFAKIQQQEQFAASADAIDSLLEVVAQVRKLKTVHKLSLGVTLTELVIYNATPARAEIIKQHEQLLKGVTRAEKIVLRATEQPNTVTQQEGMVVMHLNLSMT